MNPIVTGSIYLFLAAAVWLVPLYWVCQYARREKKNFNIVLLVGVLSSWLPALIVALLLPVLSDEQLRKLERKTEKEPMGTEGLILTTIGAMTLILLAAMAWMKTL